MTRETHQVVVVTGASAGVGRAVVQRFARDGAWLGLLARGRAGLEGARTDVEALGGRAVAVPCDVTDAEAVERAAARVENELGPIDIWINVATATVFAEFKDYTPDEFRRVTEVSYLGYVYGTMAALRRMLRRNKGTIVQVGSALAYRGIPLQSAYCGAKHAINGFTESLRCELLHDGSDVAVCLVQLPALDTPQFGWSRNKMGRRAQPVPPIYAPEVAADGIHFAAMHKRREMYVGGPTAAVIVGEKVAPDVGDHYLAATGFDSQMLDENDPPGRPDNLFAPLDDLVDHGPRGTFGDRAHTRSFELWASKHKWALGALGAGAAATAIALLGRLHAG